MNNRIVLITGPKHSGKTRCARALGEILGVKAVDLDELVKATTGKTPRELFHEGADVFRKAEAKALSSLLQAPVIIAAGGGLIDNTEAIALLAQCSEKIIVCLDVSAETAWQRILDNTAGGELPPFLNTENPQETHLALHERRTKAYKALAHLVIDVENKSPETMAKEIAAKSM